MKFLVKKGDKSKPLLVNFSDNGRTFDINKIKELLYNATIYFSMKNIENNNYKILMKQGGVTRIKDSNEYAIFYKFDTKEIDEKAIYEGEFLIKTEEGLIILPINQKLIISVS